MTSSKTLTIAQLLVLATAAKRPNHFILPVPAELRVRGGALRSLLATLLKLKLVDECPVDPAGVAWRTDDAGHSLGLRLTTVGLAAAGILKLSTQAPGEKAGPLQTPVADTIQAIPTDATSDVPPIRAPSGKLGQVLQVISTDTGASLSEITALTNWLPHTARAAVTGLRQRGFPIHLVEHDGRKAYRRKAAG